MIRTFAKVLHFPRFAHQNRDQEIHPGDAGRWIENLLSTGMESPQHGTVVHWACLATLDP